MAKLMRHFDISAKEHWDRAGKVKAQWIADKDLPPRMLTGWSDDSPSMWIISESETEPPSKDDILVALCRHKKGWEKIAYIMFEEGAVVSAGLKLRKTPGNTTVPFIDKAERHFEIENLTARKVCDLILAILERGFQTGVFKESECRERLYEMMDAANELRKKMSTRPLASSTTPVLPAAASATNSPEFRKEKGIENFATGLSAPAHEGTNQTNSGTGVPGAEQ